MLYKSRVSDPDNFPVDEFNLKKTLNCVFTATCSFVFISKKRGITEEKLFYPMPGRLYGLQLRGFAVWSADHVPVFFFLRKHSGFVVLNPQQTQEAKGLNSNLFECVFFHIFTNHLPVVFTTHANCTKGLKTRFSLRELKSYYCKRQRENVG